MLERIVFAALAAVSIAAAPISHAANPGAFEKANDAYAAGDFQGAEKLYPSVVETGNYSANLFYNLGNTSFRLNQPGQAALNYERALALNPSHPEANADIALLHQNLNSHVPSPHWAGRLYPSVRLDQFAAVAAVAGWIILFCVLALVAGVGRRRPIIAAAVLAAMLLIYSAPAIWLDAANKDLAIITAAQSVARFAPAQSAAPAETLPAGSHVRILAERGEWTYGVLPDARRAWIVSKDLDKVRLPRS